MLQRVREWLTLGLIVLLPFHALAVTVLTKLIAGPGHAPLSMIAFWKEGLLGLIIVIALLEILKTKNRSQTLRLDLLDDLILFLIGLALFVTGSQSSIAAMPFALGFKYDFIPLVAFLILRRVDWSDVFKMRAVLSILWVAFITSVYGIATLFLPDSFFTLLGYSDLHSLYVANGPIAAFQQIGGSSLHRIQSTFSGPNQFGIWLLLPIGLIASHVIPDFSKRKQSSWFFSKTPSPAARVLPFIALALTFSRAAWIGAFVIVVLAIYPWFKAHITRGRVLGAGFLGAALLFVALALFPNTLLRLSSTRGHIERPIEAIQKMIAHPFGLGLGSAGPATNRSSDTCVMLRPEDDPSWAKPHPELCVFLGEKQVQPVDRTCNCPFVPENWYLQIGVELGWLGFVLYMALIVLVLRKLSVIGYRLSGIFYAFLAVSIAGLFLHSWEDAAIAYTTWLMIASNK